MAVLMHKQALFLDQEVHPFSVFRFLSSFLLTLRWLPCFLTGKLIILTVTTNAQSCVQNKILARQADSASFSLSSVSLRTFLQYMTVSTLV